MYKRKQMYFIYSIIIFLLFSFSFSNLSNSNVSISSERYITDENGNILMNINVIGHVKIPGNHLVYDGIDLGTIISVVGGPLPGAKIDKVMLFRDRQDENGKIKYEIDLYNFYKNGDRSDFVKIMPNDTIVINQTMISSIFRGTNVLPVLLQILNITLQLAGVY